MRFLQIIRSHRHSIPVIRITTQIICPARAGKDDLEKPTCGPGQVQCPRPADAADLVTSDTLASEHGWQVPYSRLGPA